MKKTRTWLWLISVGVVVMSLSVWLNLSGISNNMRTYLLGGDTSATERETETLTVAENTRKEFIPEKQDESWLTVKPTAFYMWDELQTGSDIVTLLGVKIINNGQEKVWPTEDYAFLNNAVQFTPEICLKCEANMRDKSDAAVNNLEIKFGIRGTGCYNLRGYVESADLIDRLMAVAPGEEMLCVAKVDGILPEYKVAGKYTREERGVAFNLSVNITGNGEVLKETMFMGEKALEIK